MNKLQRLKGDSKLKKLYREIEVNRASPILPQGQRCLLLDTSGSMNSMDDTGRRKIESLAELIQDFPHEVKFVFNDDVYKFENEDDLAPEGSTRLATALATVHDGGMKHIILITDGRPTESRRSCLEAARVIKRLDILYVGPEPAPKFLEELARASKSGSYGEVQLGNLEIAEGKVKALLG